MSDSKTLINTLIGLSENAFGRDSAYALLANLKDIRDEDWEALPPGGGRPIVGILEHVGWAKLMYQDYAFGPGTISSNQPFLIPSGLVPVTPHTALLDWLQDAHRCWIASLAALSSDAELEQPRPVGWGGTLLTQDIIRIVIAHDIYHAGEINHLRALLQGNDHW